MAGISPKISRSLPLPANRAGATAGSPSSVIAKFGIRSKRLLKLEISLQPVRVRTEYTICHNVDDYDIPTRFHCWASQQWHPAHLLGE
jgi:hypothetical protein